MRLYLRLLKEPICLFGEQNAERRDRLRDVIYAIAEIPQELIQLSAKDNQAEKGPSDDGEFFVMGSVEYYNVRKELVPETLKRAKLRIENERREKSRDISQVKSEREAVYNRLFETSLSASQFGSERPLSAISLLKNEGNTSVLVGCFGGSIKMFDTVNCNLMKTFKGHSDRICGLTMMDDFIASCSSDKLINLYKTDNQEAVLSLSGHAHRVSQVKFHPFGKLLGSASYDTSWRLWDLTTGKELMLQEGHSMEVTSLDFQCDGGISATGGMDAICRVWDLRTTNAIITLQGHQSAVLSVAFSPNG